MTVMAFNGSPRKGWNTATLLGKALEGAAAQGAGTELVHLYDLKFSGCRSCFACKRRGGRSYGRCAARDALTPILEKAREASALILGSPIYFGSITGEMKCFMERLLYPYLEYTPSRSSAFGRPLPTAFVYTMNTTEAELVPRGYQAHLDNNEGFMKRVFGRCETLCSFDTWQFDDYSKVVADRFDVEQKAARRREVFPDDCRKAFELGARLAAS